MKTHSLLVALLCIAGLSATAQTEKGNNFIGGSVGYTNSTSKPANSAVYGDTESRMFDLVPKFGHFFKRNFALGLGIGYQESKNVSGANVAQAGAYGVVTVTSRSKNFNVSPFVRYYVDIAEKFKFYGQGTLSVGFGKTRYSAVGYQITASQGTKYKFTNYIAAINPGFAFFPAKKWAIEFSFPLVSYTKQKLKDDGVNPVIQAADVQNFSFGLNSFNPNIGLNYHF